MKIASFRTALVFIALISGPLDAFAQAPAPISIPLKLIYSPAGDFPAQYRLRINVGINNGPSRTYLFDTGSSLFNAAYNHTHFPGIPPAPGKHVPSSPLSNGNGITI